MDMRLKNCSLKLDKYQKWNNLKLGLYVKFYISLKEREKLNQHRERKKKVFPLTCICKIQKYFNSHKSIGPLIDWIVYYHLGLLNNK